jgi:hypothetical protein
VSAVSLAYQKAVDLLGSSIWKTSSSVIGADITIFSFRSQCASSDRGLPPHQAAAASRFRRARAGVLDREGAGRRSMNARGQLEGDAASFSALNYPQGCHGDYQASSVHPQAG